MRSTGRLVSILGLISLAGCVSSGDPSAVRPLAIAPEAALASVNAFRQANDLPALRLDERLMAAARQQSDAMAARGRLDHDVAGRLTGRLDRAGYDWSATAENIGRGYRDYPAAMEGWIGSPEHRRNLLNPRVTEVGFAGSVDSRDGRNYWTQIFGAEREAMPSGVTASNAPAGGWWPPR